MKRKAISLLSGGLDSLLASKIILDQGIELLGLHYTSPLCNGFRDDDGRKALRAGQELGIRVIVQDKGEEYLGLVRNPKHGYGKNMNPCIDCRIYMLQLSGRLMIREDASFIVTGEVLGQRPMSQRRETMRLIERESGLEGLIVRPLSAKLFPPTLPEREGILNRGKLFDVCGRSRRRQYELTEGYGLTQFACPAGGCLLTDPIFAGRLRDLFDHDATFSLEDIALLRIGRHFRFQGKRLVFGRNEEENNYLETFRHPPYSLIRPKGFKGPSGVVKEEPDETMLRMIAAIMASYGRDPGSPVSFDVYDGELTEHAVEATDTCPEQYRIKESL